MKTIWKYVVESKLEMPTGARIIHADIQNEEACLWAIVDPEAPKETRSFAIRGTGHPVDDKLEYVFSWQQGIFVWHLFEEKS